MNVYSDFTIPAFGRHVRILFFSQIVYIATNCVITALALDNGTGYTWLGT
jgi:hypothetical protein